MKKPQEQPLSLSMSGSTVKIVAFTGGREFQHRLLGLGLTIGSEIEVIRGGRGKRQPVLVGRHGSRLMVGHGMAEKIVVRPVDRPVAVAGSSGPI